LNAVRRELEGSKHAQYARQSGLVPGLIYGIRKRDSAGVCREETLKVYVKESDLRAESNRSKQSFLNTLYDVTVDGKTYRVLPRDLQLHPFKPKFIACNWYLYVPGKYPGTKVDLPLVVANEERCPAIKDGAWLLQLVHKLPVYASGDTIPQALVMDLRGRRMGEKVMASDINLGGFLSLVSGVWMYGCSRNLTCPPILIACGHHKPHALSPPPLFVFLKPAFPRARLCSGQVCGQQEGCSPCRGCSPRRRQG